jgi:2-polyprenyl-3-methyl-5-hydroxy-6-metoxy-1,4-benzoquinol methylase
VRAVNCNFCGGDDNQPLYSLRDWRLNLPGEFLLVECQVCGLMYLSPQPEWPELIQHYPDEYAPYVKQAATSGYHRWRERQGLRRRCRAVARFQPGGSLLDVGCATGQFLDEMRQRGKWETFGVEPVVTPATFAREQFGLNVFTGTLEEAHFPEQMFDVITLWDVLEHVVDPKRTLQEAYRILKPGGWLVVQVPEPHSWQARWFGRYWVGFDAPRHLYAFPQRTFLRQLAELGFDMVIRRALEGGNSIFWRSLRAWCDGERRDKVLRSLSSSVIAHGITAPLFPALRVLDLGPSTAYFGRKEVRLAVDPTRPQRPLHTGG